MLLWLLNLPWCRCQCRQKWPARLCLRSRRKLLDTCSVESEWTACDASPRSTQQHDVHNATAVCRHQLHHCLITVNYFSPIHSQYCTSHCHNGGTGPAADDHSPQFTNQNIKYMTLVPYHILAGRLSTQWLPNENPKYASAYADMTTIFLSDCATCPSNITLH